MLPEEIPGDGCIFWTLETKCVAPLGPAWNGSISPSLPRFPTVAAFKGCFLHCQFSFSVRSYANYISQPAQETRNLLDSCFLNCYKSIWFKFLSMVVKPMSHAFERLKEMRSRNLGIESHRSTWSNREISRHVVFGAVVKEQRIRNALCFFCCCFFVCLFFCLCVGREWFPWKNLLGQQIRIKEELSIVFLSFFNVYFYFWDRERAWTREGQRERETQNPKQAPSSGCQHRAQRGARTHGVWDHDLSRSQMLNRLSHPGALSSAFSEH